MAAVTLGNGDVHRAGLGWVGEEVVEVRSAGVAHDRAGAAGEGRRELAGSGHEQFVADCVDAAMDRMQTTGP